jgi:ABC-type antimicrobial peptide transport system permease subunit
VDERGKPFKVRIVATLATTILQGGLLIDEDRFIERFPSESGYKMFLIDAPPERAVEVAAYVSERLEDFGLEASDASRRLVEFSAVENTYLSTFQVLGGLGLLLGSIGMGVVVLRNVLERRGELALLRAVGFKKSTLRWLIAGEHGVLLLAGLFCGLFAAVVAVVPALRSPGADIPYESLGWTMAGVLVSGLVWTWLAVLLALRGNLLDGLRNEGA